MATLQAERPPPYSSAYAPVDQSLKLPSVSRNAVSPGFQKIPTLEPLPTMMSPPHRTRTSPDLPSAPNHAPSYQTKHGTILQPYNFPAVPSTEPELRLSPTSALSLEEKPRDQSVSMEDADDRMAAEALCGLGKVESARSVQSQPSGFDTPLKYYKVDIAHTSSEAHSGEAEPLLSLLTSSHPWLGGTINGSLSAYSSTKSHSPRFIQYGADFVERTIGNPVANTVGTVGRKTGVEGSLRRYLGSRQSSDLDHIDPEILGEQTESKRRRLSEEDDVSTVSHSPRRTLSGHASLESLPVYDENRSPPYEDSQSMRLQQRQMPRLPRSWSTQLMISTSGLGAALNEASLRSLKYVLGMLRSANGHVTRLMEALKRILLEYEPGRGQIRLEEGGMSEKDGVNGTAARTGSVAERIQKLNDEIWNTVKSVVTIVSRYTGGVLPENASVIVRWQLLSVPQRWQKAVSSHAENVLLVSSGDKGAVDDKEAFNSGHRMLAFAVEGLDMMEQVGGVVDSTILSAERWLESMGRKARRTEPIEPAPADVKVIKAEPDDVDMLDPNRHRKSVTVEKQEASDGMLVDTTS